jgi:hypothetical protein
MEWGGGVKNRINIKVMSSNNGCFLIKKARTKIIIIKNGI